MERKAGPAAANRLRKDLGQLYRLAAKRRLALELLLVTGASRLDAVGLTRANIRGGRITFRRAKTSVAVELPLLPELEHELALLPSTQMVLLARNDGETGYAVESFGILFRRWCNEAGVPGSAHGLRKAAATEFEVLSFLGHATAKEANRYVAAANRATLADSGMAKLVVESESKLSNLPAW